MIILSENNYKKLEKIPHVEDPEKNPDIVLYPYVFNEYATTKLIKTLNSINFNGNKGWFTDNPTWIFKKTIPTRPFPPFIEKIREDVELITGRTFNACFVLKSSNTRLFDVTSNKKWLGYDFIIPTVSVGAQRKIIFKSKLNDDIKTITVGDGSLVVRRESVDNYWTSQFKSEDKSFFYDITFFRVYPPETNVNICLKLAPFSKQKIRLPYELEKIYLSTKLRMEFTRKIKNGLTPIHSIKEGSQCFMKNGINSLKKYIKLEKLIGTGDWGNVYNACLPTDTYCRRKFALKMSRITSSDFKDPYTETSSAWYEIWMLKDILKPLVSQNICPNLPLFIDTFLCDKCDFIFRKGDNQHPCVITVMELASGDMKDYLKFSRPSNDEIYSALFQIMAALHAIQISGQILNNDIKSKNILVYNVKPGGYWHYKIGKHNFYVPNYGKMFVLNDFGVSTLYNPNFQLYPNKNRKMFSLGTRLAINIDGIFSPITASVEYTNDGLHKTRSIKWIDGSINKTSNGATYKIDRKTGQVIVSHTVLTPIQKSYLFRKGVSTNPKTWSFFEHPNIIPPFEFYNDVQDLLRTFVGGKRTTQRGNHTLYPSISKKIQNTIKPYLGVAENAKKREFSIHAYQVLAGEFIIKFFTSYKTRPTGKKISFYDMNKCLSR